MVYNMESFKLSGGTHDSREQGVCLMEAVAYLAGERHHWRPECADWYITDLAAWLNDLAPDELRDELLGEFPWRIVGTRTENRYINGKRCTLLGQWVDMFKTCLEKHGIYISSVLVVKTIVPQSDVLKLIKDGMTILDEMIKLTEIQESPMVGQKSAVYNEVAECATS